jgi:hypothetical protein
MTLRLPTMKPLRLLTMKPSTLLMRPSTGVPALEGVLLAGVPALAGMHVELRQAPSR